MPRSYKLRQIVRCPICKSVRSATGIKTFFCCGKAHDIRLNTVNEMVEKNDNGKNVKRSTRKSDRSKSDVPNKEVSGDSSNDELRSNDSGREEVAREPVGQTYEPFNVKTKEESKNMEEKKEEIEGRHDDCGAVFKYDENKPPSTCPECGLELEKV